jgi:hypothetical protein
MTAATKYFCLVCGYPGMEGKLYANIPDDPRVEMYGLLPPYALAWGLPSHDVCSCCGYEFGFDDEPGGAVDGLSFLEYLEKWVADGMPWMGPEPKPAGWDLAAQMSAAQLPVPDFVPPR